MCWDWNQGLLALEDLDRLADLRAEDDEVHRREDPNTDVDDEDPERLLSRRVPGRDVDLVGLQLRSPLLAVLVQVFLVREEPLSDEEVEEEEVNLGILELIVLPTHIVIKRDTSLNIG